MIKKDTIIRTVILAVALINQILTSTGHGVLPISDEEITEGLTLAFTVVSALAAWWKNNSFTRAAVQADERMREMKNRGK